MLWQSIMDSDIEETLKIALSDGESTAKEKLNLSIL